MKTFCMKQIDPHIRYVNNYKVNYTYVESPRKLYDYELMFIAEGHAVMHYNKKRYHLEKNDIFYLKPNIENHIYIEEGSGFRTHCIHFDWVKPSPENDFSVEEFYLHSFSLSDHEERSQKLEKRPQPCPEDFTLPAHTKGRGIHDFAGLFARCYYHYIESDLVNYLYLKSAFYEIIALLYTQCCPKYAAKIVHPQIQQAQKYIAENYSLKLSVPVLAAKYNLSPKYFGMLFKQATDKSVSQYIRDIRIQVSMEMLSESNLSLEQIADTIGFENSFYFSNCFKKTTGIAPSEYRRLSQSISPESKIPRQAD